MLKSEQRLNAVLSDRTHGSRTIARGVIEVLKSDLLPEPITQAAYLDFARSVTLRIPSFALVFDLLHAIGCLAYTHADSVPASGLRDLALEWSDRWEAAQFEVRAQGLRLLADVTSVVTFSASGAVAAILEAAASAGRTLTVLGSEAMPGGEGQAFLQAAAELGHRVRQLTDAQLPAAAESADLVLVGADAVFADRFWNKIGTHDLCRAAHASHVPVYVVAETMKWVPSDWGLRIEPTPDLPSAAATEHNTGPTVLFESISLDLVTAVISEAGLATVDAIGQVIAAKASFDPL